MFYRVLADLVLILYLSLVLFALFGGLGVFKWPRLIKVHAPIAVLLAALMLAGRPCPLIPLEHGLRLKAGVALDRIGIVEQYLTPLFYPTPLNRRFLMVLGVLLVAVNAVIYAWIGWRSTRLRTPSR